MTHTSEYVSLGHPDKTADYISEYILDAALKQDKNTRYAIEVQIKDNIVNLAGELTTNATLDFEKLIKEAVEDIGYTEDYVKLWGNDNCINPTKLEVHAYISQQSPDIAKGVNKDAWGDQGIFWGMAVPDKTTDYMPKDYQLAKCICQQLYSTRLNGLIGLDIKTQVAINSVGNIKEVIIAAPTFDNVQAANAAKQLVDKFAENSKYNFVFNGTGQYIKHSTFGDSGTTGRKLAVDFYGGNCIIGGGSPWTKDGTKADLALNIYARYVAKQYAIKTNNTIYVALSTFIGSQEVQVEILDENMQLIDETTELIPPSVLIEKFKLQKPIFADMCKKGLFVNA